MDYSVIKKIPGTLGGCGDRFMVNTKASRATQVFKSICVWEIGSILESDGSKTITYELPIGHHIEENPLIMYWLDVPY